MAIIIEGILILATLMVIISFITPKKDDKKNESNNATGLYEVELKIGSKKINVTSEVELLKEYDSDEISVKHISIVKPSFEGLNSDSEALNILRDEHSLINKDDVKWEVNKTL